MNSTSSNCMNSECEVQTNQNKQKSNSRNLQQIRSKPSTRIKILQKRYQNNEVKKFRDSVRNIYHQSDYFASYTQHSITAAPLETRNVRILLSQNHYSRYKEQTQGKNQNSKMNDSQNKNAENEPDGVLNIDDISLDSKSEGSQI